MTIGFKRSSLGFVFVFLLSFPAISVLAAATFDPCSPRDLKQLPDRGDTGVQTLLKAIQIGTNWADLPAETKVELQIQANNRLAAFRRRWAKDALRLKEAILLGCPTSQMTAAVDEYYRKSYKTFLPTTFSLVNLESVDLRRALVRNYLGAIKNWGSSLALCIPANGSRIP